MNHLKSWALRYVIGLIAACVALSFVIFQSTASATDLTTRATKGSALTYNELDANFDIGAQNKAASYPIAYTDNRDTIEFDGASLTATLPDVATVVGQADTGDFQVTLVNLNASALTVARTGTDTIGGGTSYSLPQWASATFKANNATDGWDIIGAVDVAADLKITGDITITTPTVTGTWTDLGTVTTADINGGTYDGGAIATSTVAATTLSSSGNTTIGDAAGDAFTINPSAWTLNNAVTVTGTWADLGTVTTADINGGTINGITDLAVVDGGTGASDAATARSNLGAMADSLPIFKAHMSGNQALTSGVITKVQFDTEDFDTNSDYDSATNYRFTPTKAGYYEFHIQLGWGISATSSGLYVYLYKNGAADWYNRQTFTSGGSLPYNQQLTVTEYANGSTDYFEVYAFQNSGGSLSVFYNSYSDSFWQGHYIGN